MKIATILKNLIAALVLGLISLSASALTECETYISKIYVGDGGLVWVVAASAPQFYVGASDPNVRNILAMSSLALALGKTVTVRFAADGVPCAAGGALPAVGMWLN